MPDNEVTIKDIYGDTITVSHNDDSGTVELEATEANVITPGVVELILTNAQRKQLRKALKRPKR